VSFAQSIFHPRAVIRGLFFGLAIIRFRSITSQVS
jgi:hypothetical protein